MANEKNLIPFYQRTESEQREITRKGGIASGEARRQRKLFREALTAILPVEIKDEQRRRMLYEKLGVKDPTLYEEILFSLIQKARKGDIKAIQTIIELNDGKQTQTIDLQSGGKAFTGFDSVLPNVEGIEEMMRRLEEERERRLEESE